MLQVSLAATVRLGIAANENQANIAGESCQGGKRFAMALAVAQVTDGDKNPATRRQAQATPRRRPIAGLEAVEIDAVGDHMDAQRRRTKFQSDVGHAMVDADDGRGAPQGLGTLPALRWHFQTRVDLAAERDRVRQAKLSGEKRHADTIWPNEVRVEQIGPPTVGEFH